MSGGRSGLLDCSLLWLIRSLELFVVVQVGELLAVDGGHEAEHKVFLIYILLRWVRRGDFCIPSPSYALRPSAGNFPAVKP